MLRKQAQECEHLLFFIMDHHVTIIVILAVGFAVASLLGYIAQRLKLPSILGYLLAGYLIGPHFPGFSADMSVAQQLAEVGVVLMLFGVGLHFKLQDLINVRHIALPGAIGQTAVAAVAGTAFMFFMGLPFATSVIIGLAISVASTVVLVRLLTDNNLLTTQEGHISVGWLIVEDIFTVAVLILLPMFADFFHGEQLSISHIFTAIAFILGKFVILAPALYLYGHKIVGYVLTSVARLRSQELFTLTILALAFSIATAASFLFGASLALGAFVAGMIIGQTDVRHQAVANSLPLQDVFAVIFLLLLFRRHRYFVQ